MITTKGFLSTLGLVAVVGLSGCSSKSKQAEKAPPTPAQAAASQLETDRVAYVNRTQTRVDQMTEFSRQLRTTSQGIAAADAAKAKKQQNAADDLDSLLTDVRKELGDVKSAQTANWVDEKRDVEKVMSRAETQYSNSVTLMQ